MPNVTVIIPALNAEASLPTQLDALARQEGVDGFEVLVCDNGSTDGTREVALSYRDRLPGLRVVDASSRRGASHARNRGIVEASGDVLAFCDADDMVAVGWVAAFAAATRPGLIVRGYMDMRTFNRPAWYGNGSGIEKDFGPQRGYLPGIGAGNFAISAADARAIGGFDESYVYGVEDFDFAWRAQQAGLTMIATPAVLHCRLRGTARGVFRQYRNYGRGGIQLVVVHRERLGDVISFRYSLSALVRFTGRWLRSLLPHRGLAQDAQADERRESARRLGAALGECEGHLRFRYLGSPPSPRLIEEPDAHQ